MIPIDAIRIVYGMNICSVADIGAANGVDTVKLAELFDDAEVYGFEPVHTNVQYAEKWIASQPRDIKNRIHFYEVALSNKKGRFTLFRSTGQPYENAPFEHVDENGDWRLSSSLLPPDKHKDIYSWCGFRREEADVTTLDLWAKKSSVTKIDFVHMDVQGAELQVLEGAQDLIDSFKAVWLEVASVTLYKQQPTVDKVSAYMKGHGFKLALDKIKPGDPEGDQLWIRY